MIISAPRRQQRLPVAAATFAVAALLAGCGQPAATGDTPSGQVSSPAPAATPPPTGQTPTRVTPSSATSSSAAADVSLDITITGGKVGTVQTVKVAEGQSVVINAVSDTADSLHVHGYDLSSTSSLGSRHR